MRSCLFRCCQVVATTSCMAPLKGIVVVVAVVVVVVVGGGGGVEKCFCCF